MITEFFANRTAAKLARKEEAAKVIKAYVAKFPATKASVMARLSSGHSAESVAASCVKAEKIYLASLPARTSSKFYR
jgi:hypothetical protein